MSTTSKLQAKARILANLAGLDYADARTQLTAESGGSPIQAYQPGPDGEPLFAASEDNVLARAALDCDRYSEAEYPTDNDGGTSTILIAIVEVSGGHQVWCDGDGGLCLEAVCDEYREAVAAVDALIDRAMEAATQDLEYRQDQEWADTPESAKEWAWPMTFRDTTDFQRGWELEDMDGLVAFLDRHLYVFETLEANSLYSWSLLDADFEPCHVLRSHRGEYRLMDHEQAHR